MIHNSCNPRNEYLFMDKSKSKYGSAHRHRWNWQCWNKLPGVSAEGGIVDFVEELCLRFGLFDDSTQIRLQEDNLLVFHATGQWHVIPVW